MQEIETLLIVAGLLCLRLFIKILSLKGQIRHLTRQLEEITNGETEKMLSMSLVDADLENLGAQLNRNFVRQKEILAKTVQREEHLKESIANISHDLRTPLTVIIGYLQLLQKSPLPPEQKQQVGTAMQKAGRMKELIVSFYELSIVDSDELCPQIVKINVSNLLMEILSEYATALEEKGICPQIEMPEKSVFVMADKNMLERMVQNLFANAVRYTSGQITVRLQQSPSKTMILQVENEVPSGCDIDTERLFDRFYIGNAARNTESTGLGLAIVKLLAEKSGGFVTAKTTASNLCITLEI